MNKLYTSQDLIEFENHKRYSSLGKMLESLKSTAPAYGFGTSTRKQAQQIYRDKKLLIKGKHSPGPQCYNSNSLDLLNKEVNIKIGNAQRQFLNQTQYDYYERQDQHFEPQKANDFRRMNSSKIRFGLAQRFSTEHNSQVPGPDYYDNLKSTKGIQYTMQPRRPISKSFQNIVGPGSYNITQNLQNSISFTKEERLKPNKSFDRNQTYDITGSLGIQLKSKNKTKPAYSIGKQSREIQPIILKKDMEGVKTKIKISMPKF